MGKEGSRNKKVVHFLHKGYVHPPLVGSNTRQHETKPRNRAVGLSFVVCRVPGTRKRGGNEQTPKKKKCYFWLARWRCVPRAYASDRNLQKTNNDDTISPIQSVFFQN
jgi:hypothetical protein